MPLTDARLSRIRGRADDFLTQSCVIEAPSSAVNSAGMWQPSYSARGTVSCYLAAHGVSDIGPQNERIVVYTEYTLHIAYDETIAPGDRVTLDSRTYKVESVIEPDSVRATKMAKLTMEGDGT